MRVGVVGAGGWGTALAKVSAFNAKEVYIWAREPEVLVEINNDHTNRAFLPGVDVPENVMAVDSFEAFEMCSLIIMVVPSSFVREVSAKLRPALRPGTPVANAAKGFEVSSQKRLSEVLEEELGTRHPLATISGPNHAEEVGRELPTATVVAADNLLVATEFQDALMTPFFRVYTSVDVVGVELGGALKNIIALAAGIADGLGFGDNTKAALMTRGMTEIIRLGKHLGARPATFTGLSGMGDLIATCTSAHSRNRSAGLAIGQGKTLSDILGATNMVIEGVNATRAAHSLSLRHNVRMPITNALHGVLFEQHDPSRAVGELMTRLRKTENEEELPF
jgi:glycerol-3-phosphate dehydrogenase (NAD(P)+)